MNIAGRRIGEDHPVYVVAEVSANHNGSYEQAARIIRAAKEADADAVKLQTYTPDTMTIRCDAAPFQIGGGTLWDGRSLYELYGEAYTPWEWQPQLKALAESIGLDFFSTAFDASAVAFLEEMKVSVHKIASFEIVDLPLIETMAHTGKPIIISTGMAALSEIEAAVETARQSGASDVMLLHCTSAYPAPPDAMNLRTIPHLAQAFDCAVGLSDHTPGSAVAVASVALGACLVEKHLTLSRDEPGPDAAFSLEPHEFKAMAQSVRAAQQALGRVRYGANESEAASLVFRRSLFVVEDMRAGETFTTQNVRSIRPGHGLPPARLPEVLGRRAARDISRGAPLSPDCIA